MSRFILIITVLLVAACSSSRKNAKTVMLEGVTVNATDDAYRATATMSWDITHTAVSLDFNLAEKTANGRALIDMHPYFYSSDKIVLDAKSMNIANVTVNGDNARINYSNDSLTIYLDRLYHRTESVRLDITYKAMPYAKATSGGKAISDDKGLYFINTDQSVPYKPSQIWTQGETESNSFWVPTFDKPNERFTTSIQLTVPDSFTTLSNGMFTGSTTKERGTRTDTWVMDKDIQPYVMMFAIGNYKVVEDKEWRGKKVNYYVEPEFAPYAPDMFRNTPEMMEFFSNITGVPYPWNKYSQVVVRDYVSGAMENTSATVFGEFINQTSREIMDVDYEDIVSHELFHQWFGDYVTAESWSNLTLNESFATYGEQMWRKYKYGVASAQKLGFEDMILYMNQTEKNDEPLTRFHYKRKDDIFDRISYQKGASILHYMHGLMGDSAFYSAMNIYLTENALQPAETHHWRLAVEKATGKDWNWFFNQWYFRGGHPVLNVTYDFDDAKKQVKITLEQKQSKIYELPLKINVVSKGNTFSDMVTLDKRIVTVTYPYYDSQQPAIFADAEHWLVGAIYDNKTPEHWLRCYQLADKEDFIAKARALMTNAKKTDNTTIQQMYKAALADDLEHIKVYALHYLASQKAATVQNALTPDVVKLTKDQSNHVRAAAFDLLTAWGVKSSVNDMYMALNDESYKVAGAALEGIMKFNKDTAYSLAKSIYATQPAGELEMQVWDAIGNEGIPADTVLIKKQQYLMGAKDKISFSYSMYDYMTNTPSDQAFKVALDAVEYMTASEAIAPYRTAISANIFDAGQFFKNEVRDANTKTDVAKANTRLNMILKTLSRLEGQETDEDNKTTYKNKTAELTGKKS